MTGPVRSSGRPAFWSISARQRHHDRRVRGPLAPVVTGAGRIIVLNGAPRSGKSSIVAAIQDSFPDGPWMNLGLDVFRPHVTPAECAAAIGRRVADASPSAFEQLAAGAGAGV